jgi:hypothetical protein
VQDPRGRKVASVGHLIAPFVVDGDGPRRQDTVALAMLDLGRRASPD